ncbi:MULTISPECIES: helix-turn-helix transcriptional regulator [Paenarthrobacter]|uniref:helix-turn-helix transcriptional regulator n=1 Tax=Paenarthrobacter TaxID=1742992 RepID=UPI001878F7B0|nr:MULTISPECIES: helix-turn-helix domain-containing protein [Paenarthrobacter]QOT16414.1 transcriptional regulator [Paenarthrobacter sp. YJN-5]UOD80037.1 transcriptional regulator [Paenarthrobacter ureafaciens]WNZ04620.1 transcriptional regulator [Paenarthrobacter ureafaciens]
MSKQKAPWLARIAALASMDDTNRRALFRYVGDAADAVGRDQAAEALGIPRSTASFHLDRLVRDGVLQVEFRKTSAKSGPGSGRPSKFYRTAVDEVGASVPDRHYDLAGDVMARAISTSLGNGGSVAEALEAAAHFRGRESGRPGEFSAVLADLGYEPVEDGSGGYRLLNCPFHRLSRDHADVVCAMNGALLKGAAESSGLPADSVVPDPGPGHCCARITAAR